jgi:two-component system, OmpR family, phosphate regulon response regulator PhoB
MEPLVLIVEDEAPQAEMLRYNLEKGGFRTLIAEDGEEGLILAREHNPDIAILDWMLPGLSGIDLCRRLRDDAATKNIPIILLTARGEEDDRVQGLDSGADDYVVKPFSPKEMLARVRALLRRMNPDLAGETLSYGDIEMDMAAHKVTRAGRNLHLGPTEYRLLRTLMERPGRVLSRDRLLDLAWGRDVYVEDRTVDVHVRRLRVALNAHGAADVIRTVRGEGYSLDDGSS